MTHKAFEAAAQEANGEPVTFTVGDYPYTFRVNTPLPMGQLIIFSRAVKKGKSQDAVSAIDDLLRTWIFDEDLEEWDKCLSQLTKLDVLGEIINYVVEEATGRPTQASSS